MNRIVLIACAKTKKPQRAEAKDLYTSALFRKSLRYARSLDADAIFILSAKYGLLDLSTEIEPYDLTLNTMPVSQVRAWSARVLDQLRARADLDNDHFIFLASDKYRRFLIPHIKSFEVPMKGLRQGEQLAYLNEQVVR